MTSGDVGRRSLKPEVAQQRAERRAEVVAQMQSRAKSARSGQADSEWTLETLTGFLALGGSAACACGAIKVDGGDAARGTFRYMVRGTDSPYLSAEFAALAALGGIHDLECDGVLR